MYNVYQWPRGREYDIEQPSSAKRRSVRYRTAIMGLEDMSMI